MLSQKVFVKLSVAVLLISLFSGCASNKPPNLIPTPLLYRDTKINPFAHLPKEKKTTYNTVHFATLREPEVYKGELGYGSRISSQLHLGRARIQMGKLSMQWADLERNSLLSKRDQLVPLSLTKIDEIAQLSKSRSDEQESKFSKQNLTPEQQKFIDEINAELDDALDQEILLYVHGTKVAFNNAAIMAAEMDHFSGRDFVSICFSWPSHQNIISYLVGTDVQRAKDASQSLAVFIEFLATHTKAKRINVFSFSAGARTTSKALYDMALTASTNNFGNFYKLGSIVYAAADVPIDTFLERLPASSLLAEKVILTVSDKDDVLLAARRFMHGRPRVGAADAELDEEKFITQTKLSNVEIIDVSLGKASRGFDITGHHYWYNHPWISSDMIFLLRTDLPALKRGLSPSEFAGVWFLASEYPAKVAEAANRELQTQWQPKD